MACPVPDGTKTGAEPGIDTIAELDSIGAAELDSTGAAEIDATTLLDAISEIAGREDTPVGAGTAPVVPATQNPWTQP